MTAAEAPKLYPQTPWEDVSMVETMSGIELAKEAAQRLCDSREALEAAAIQRIEAEADLRHVFFEVLTDAQRAQVVGESSFVDQQLADINNGYRYGERK